MNKGVEFETAIVLNLEKRFNSSLVKIANIYEGYSIEKFKETISEMKKGTPIICSGILHNKTDNTYGIPDIIVRSDFINKIVQEPILSDDEEKIGCLFSDNWHYRIIDIKFATLNFHVNKSTIKNIGNIRAYKSQVIIYNKALGLIQGYEPNGAFLLGRKIKKKDEKFNCFYTLGFVDINDYDNKLLSKINNAIRWIKRLKKYGHKWNPEDLVIKELYPNMSNNDDYPWHNEKKKLAHKIKELTLLWRLGVQR